MNINVVGRRPSSPVHGFGRLWDKRYRLRLDDTNLEPLKIISLWRAEFPDFWPKGNRLFTSGNTSIAPGTAALLNLAIKGGLVVATGIMVIYTDETSFSFMAIEGHILSGWITFSCFHENTSTIIQVHPLFRSSDPLIEISASLRQINSGMMPASPFVVLAQQSLFDPTRAPAGRHTAWAYCHVPQGSSEDVTRCIDDKIERYAQGFKEVILAKSVMTAMAMELYNPNYVGGDINGGVQDVFQLYTRPVVSFSPYRTSAKNIFIRSSSTPPGGGVHGLCGYYAANDLLKTVRV